MGESSFQTHEVESVAAGSWDFGKWVRTGAQFVDKTLFLQELFQSKNKREDITLITRPRRFGKTSLLSMVEHFLSPEVNGLKTQGLFEGLKIASLDGGEFVKRHQGQYPCVSLCLKDMERSTYEDMEDAFRKLVHQLFKNQESLLHSERLSSLDKEDYRRFCRIDLTRNDIIASLSFLTQVMHKRFQKPVWILIDEYDAPLYAAYVHGFWDKALNLIRPFFSQSLKTNRFLDRALLTGILRIAKESLFSDLNNVFCYTMLNHAYGQYFGFLEDEVVELGRRLGLHLNMEEVKEWYNGYTVGGQYVVYNPWSVVSYLKDDCKPAPYWVNTGGDSLIQESLAACQPKAKERFQALLKGGKIISALNPFLVMETLKSSSETLWTLMFMSGYLKAIQCPEENRGDEPLYELTSPNQEVHKSLESLVRRWLTKDTFPQDHFFSQLFSEDVEGFRQGLAAFLMQEASFHDVSGRGAEQFYQGLMLGLTVLLDKKAYHVSSNKESGLGRFDLLFTPTDKQKLGVILELKAVEMSLRHKEEFEILSSLKEKAQDALLQITRLNYQAELEKQGVSRILSVGVAFCGKYLNVASQCVTLSHLS